MQQPNLPGLEILPPAEKQDPPGLDPAKPEAVRRLLEGAFVLLMDPETTCALVTIERINKKGEHEGTQLDLLGFVDRQKETANGG